MDSSIFAGLDAAIEKAPENFKAGAQKNREILEKYLSVLDEDIWKLFFESDDKTVQSYYAKTEEGKLMAKGVATFPFKPDKVEKYARKMENKPLYDEHFEEGKIFETHEDKENQCDIFHLYMRRGNIKMVDPRDFVVNHCYYKVGDVVYSMAHSITHPDYPERKGAVRADLEFYIWKYEPGAGGKGCKMTRVFRADPKGSLPDFVKDLVIKYSGHELLDMRKSMIE